MEVVTATQQGHEAANGPTNNQVLEQKSAELDAAQANQQQPLLAGKYKTPQDLEKAYKELESKLGQQGKPPAEPQATPPANQEPPQDLSIKAAEQAAQNAGLDLGELAAEYTANNETLKPETYDRLSKAGITKDTVDQFIAGQKALAAQSRNEILTVAGGESNYKSMATWASDNLTEAEIAAYNDTVNSGDVAKAKLAVQGLKARYDAVVGTDPDLVRGGGQADAGYFQNDRQMIEAMKDPRYKNDPAYRDDVLRRASKLV